METNANSTLSARKLLPALAALSLVIAFPESLAADTVTNSDYIAITDQQGNILKDPGGDDLETFLTESEEMSAANTNKLLLINFKIDVPNIYNAGDFPTAGVHLIEPDNGENQTGLISDTIQLMVVTTTPQKITFQVQMVSDGERTNGTSIRPPPLGQATAVPETGALQDLTSYLFPQFFQLGGSQQGNPTPFKVVVASDTTGNGVIVPEPGALSLTALALALRFYRSRKPRSGG